MRGSWTLALVGDCALRGLEKGVLHFKGVLL